MLEYLRTKKNIFKIFDNKVLLSKHRIDVLEGKKWKPRDDCQNRIEIDFDC